MDRAALLGTEKVSRLLIKFSVPAIIGMLVQALYNVVDRIFIGIGVGHLGLAGATVCFPFMLIFMAFGMLIGLGGNSAVSIALGQKRKDYADHIFGNSLLLLTIGGILIMVLGLLFLEPMLTFFGASEAVLPYASAYMRIILYGALFNNIAFGLGNFIRGEGNPRMAMITMLIGAIINTILDPVFIFVFDMGIEGAAWATIISQTASMIWVLHYFIGPKSLLSIRAKNLIPDIPVIVRILLVGSAPCAMHIAASGVNAVMNNQLLRFGGDIAISVMGVIFSITTIILMPIFGINQGTQPIVGFNYGARKYDRVQRAMGLAILAASLISFSGWAFAEIFPSHILAFFDPKGVLVDEGIGAIRLFLLAFPLVGFQVVTSAYFQAVGKPGKSMFLSLSRQILFLLPALYILPHFFGLTGVYAAAPLSDFIATLVTGVLFFFEMRHLKRGHHANLQPEMISAAS